MTLFKGSLPYFALLFGNTDSDGYFFGTFLYFYFIVWYFFCTFDNCLVLFGTFWYFFVLYGTLRYFKILCVTLWYYILHHYSLWYFLVLYATFWHSMGLYGTLKITCQQEHVTGEIWFPNPFFPCTIFLT